MCHPSGDQAGFLSEARLLVSLVATEPLASITYMSRFPLRAESKAMLRPSGDQAGFLSQPGLLVSLVTSEPSAFITYMSPFPS